MARRGTGGKAPRRPLRTQAALPSNVWHPTLTTAAEQGEEHLHAALNAEREIEGGLVYEVDVQADFRHSGARLSDSGQVAEVPQSPFPPRSRFGIVPYAVWHGHDAVVAAYLHVLGANVDGQAAVPMEEHVQVHVLARSAAVRVRDWTMASALQIAVWKRDTRMVKLLLEHGAAREQPFLLDMRPLRAGTLFVTKAGKWSQEGHWCYPPAFRAAVRELLRITHKHGGVRRRDGQQLWGLNTRELQDLLLPVMGRGSMTAWVKPGDRLPEDEGAEEAGNEAAGSEGEGQE